MSGYFVLAATLIALAVVYQVYVSRRVARSPDYTDEQRLLQLIIIWALPVIGAALCQAMLGDSEAAEVANSDDPDGDDNSGDD